MIDSKRHPRVSSALILEGVQPGQPFITYEIEGDVIMRGHFASLPEYEEGDNRWTAQVVARMGSSAVSKTVRLYDMGVTPDETGENWSSRVTVPEDLE